MVHATVSVTGGLQEMEYYSRPRSANYTEIGSAEVSLRLITAILIFRNQFRNTLLILKNIEIKQKTELAVGCSEFTCSLPLRIICPQRVSKFSLSCIRDRNFRKDFQLNFPLVKQHNAPILRHN